MKQEGYSCGNARLLLLSFFLIGVVNVRAGFLDHWTTNVVSSQYGMDCITYANGRYVAYGSYSDYGYIYHSTNGTDWTLATNGTGGLSFAGSLIYAGNRFFALGRFGSFGFSTNGIDWFAPSGLMLWEHNGAAASATRNVVVGLSFNNDDLNVMYSTTISGNLVWSSAHSTSENGVRLTDVAYGAGRFVAVAGTGTSYSSANGTTWTNQAMPYVSNTTYYGNTRVSFLNNRFIVPHAAGTNLISTDGLTWAVVATGVYALMGKVNFASGNYYASAGSYLVSSVDGTNWVLYPQAIPGPNNRSSFFADTSIVIDGSRLLATDFRADSGIYQLGWVYTSDVLMGLQMVSPASPKIRISGLVGRTYRVDYTDNVPTNSWQQTPSFQLLDANYLWTDPTGGNAKKRFYRGVLLP